MKKLKRETTALVKDLELQLDYLIAYSPSGNHWKQEYHIRKTLLDNVLEDENTPKEIIEKLNKIQNKLWELQNGEKHEQGYIQYSQDDYRLKHTVIVNQFGKQIGSFEL